MTDSVRIERIGKLDYKELSKSAEGETTEFIPYEVDNGSLGDLGTGAALLPLVPSMLLAISAYLLRTHSSEEFSDEFQITRSSGEVETRRVRFKRKGSKAPQQEILEQLEEGLLS